ncbi:MAG: TVP38/TMEM64 family protein [Chloroflexota bacterium]|nr:MAG: TVP38/TMEM64 family protein [Chloroflexota bacterium]
MSGKPRKPGFFQRIQRLSTPSAVQTWLPWLGGFLFIAVLAALWLPLSHVGTNPAAIRAWLEQLGPLAPLAVFLLNVIQIVVAPIPGYPVQVLAGILFGFIPGTIYTLAGMVTGGTLAAWLGRRLGRPWLEQRLGNDTLAHWSDIAHINSFWAWWLILLIPVGDLPYFFAGLTTIRLRTFALAILASRGPFTALLVWTGSSVVDLPPSWLAALMVGIGVVVIVGFSQRARIEAWARAFVAQQATRRSGEEG